MTSQKFYIFKPSPPAKSWLRLCLFALCLCILFLQEFTEAKIYPFIEVIVVASTSLAAIPTIVIREY